MTGSSNRLVRIGISTYLKAGYALPTKPVTLKAVRLRLRLALGRPCVLRTMLCCPVIYTEMLSGMREVFQALTHTNILQRYARLERPVPTVCLDFRDYGRIPSAYVLPKRKCVRLVDLMFCPTVLPLPSSSTCSSRGRSPSRSNTQTYGTC